MDITAVSKSDLILSGETNPNAVRINSSNGFDAGVIAKYVVEKLKAKKVAFLTQNDVYGNGFQTAVEAEFKKLNFSGEVTMTEKFAFKDTDFRVQLTNLKSANPDAIIVTNSSNSSGLPAMPARSQSSYASASISSLLGSGIGFLRVEARPYPRRVAEIAAGPCLASNRWPTDSSPDEAPGSSIGRTMRVAQERRSLASASATSVTREAMTARTGWRPRHGRRGSNSWCRLTRN